MILQKLTPYSWSRYSKKLVSHILKPMHAGYYLEGDAKQRAMRLAVGKAGAIEDGNMVALYLLVDEEDGVIADAKWQVYGQSALIAAADIACEMLMRKNYEQARRISAELIDKHVRDKKQGMAFPEETFAHMNLVLTAIDACADSCMDIALRESYISTPIDDPSMQGVARLWPGWDDLTTPKQMQVIEEVFATDIRPYVELDAGGVEVINVIASREVVIAYKGSCTTCHSATGSTLSAIQHILRMKIHPDIVVTPDVSFLKGAQP